MLGHGLSNLETIHDLDKRPGQMFGTKVLLKYTQERERRTDWRKQEQTNLLRNVPGGWGGNPTFGERSLRVNDV